jgi:hypothetical protein
LHYGLRIINAAGPKVAKDGWRKASIDALERSFDRRQLSHMVPIDRWRIATSGSGSDPNRAAARPSQAKLGLGVRARRRLVS